MKRMQSWRWIPTALLLAVGGTTLRSEEFAITSFSGTGQLVFNTLNDGTNYAYRVEWAPSPTGPWRCFDGAAGLLQNILPDSYGSVTCSVPMCYRVVALPTHLRGMVLIPGGTNSGTEPDFGSYSLTVSAFYMDATEVTKAKWDEVYTWAIANGYDFDHAGSAKATDHPVQTVNWYDVVKWCNARSEKEGRPAVYTAAGPCTKPGRATCRPDLRRRLPAANGCGAGTVGQSPTSRSADTGSDLGWRDDLRVVRLGSAGSSGCSAARTRRRRPLRPGPG